MESRRILSLLFPARKRATAGLWKKALLFSLSVLLVIGDIFFPFGSVSAYDPCATLNGYDYWPWEDVEKDWDYWYIYWVGYWEPEWMLGWRSKRQGKYRYYFYPKALYGENAFIVSTERALGVDLPCEESDDCIVREKAADLLVDALGFGPAADAMGDAEAEAILDRFSDSGNISPAYRKSVAWAAVTGIVKGYPDGTFQPKRYIQKNETAALLCRSAFVRVTPQYTVLYPELGQTVVTLNFRTLKRGNRNWLHYTVIREEDGDVMRDGFVEMEDSYEHSVTLSVGSWGLGRYIVTTDFYYTIVKKGEPDETVHLGGAPAVIELRENEPPACQIVSPQTETRVTAYPPSITLKYADFEKTPASRWEIMVSDKPLEPPALALPFPGYGVWTSVSWDAGGPITKAKLRGGTSYRSALYALVGGTEVLVREGRSYFTDEWYALPAGTTGLKLEYRASYDKYDKTPIEVVEVERPDARVFSGSCSVPDGGTLTVSPDIGRGIKYLRARFYDGWGKPSEWTPETALYVNELPTASVVSPSPGQVLSSNDVTVTWSGRDSFDPFGQALKEYEVQVASDPGFSSVAARASGAYPVATGCETGGPYPVFLRVGGGSPSSPAWSPRLMVDGNVTSARVAASLSGGDVSLSAVVGGADQKVVDLSGGRAYDAWYNMPANSTGIRLQSKTYSMLRPFRAVEIRTSGPGYPNASKTLTVPGEGTRYVRVRVKDSAGQWGPWSAPVAFRVPDLTPPTGSVVINGGAPVTVDPVVTLTLSASDAGGVDSMRVRNEGGSWSAWMPYKTSMSWTLPEPKGRVKTVYVQYRDAAGNVSQEYSDSIVWDDLYAFCDPASTLPGGTSKVKLRASGSWSSVTADLSAVGLGTAPLSLEGPGLWGSASFPVGSRPGTYVIPVTAKSGAASKTVWATLSVISVGSDLRN